MKLFGTDMALDGYYSRISDRLREDSLSYKNTIALRAALIIGIIIYHLGTPFPDYVRLDMYLFVAPFFFLSGYGLSWSRVNKYNYMQTMFQKRIFAILIPLFFAVLMTNVIDFAVYNDVNRLLVFPQWTLPYHWFIAQLLCFYVAYYLSFVLFKGKKSMICLAFLIYLSMIILQSMTSFFYQYPTIYYVQGTWAFFLGVLWCEYKERIKEIGVKLRWNIIMIPVLAALTIVSLPLHSVDGFLLWDSSNVISVGTSLMITRGFQYIVYMFILLILLGSKTFRTINVSLIVIITITVLFLMSDPELIQKANAVILILSSLVVYSIKIIPLVDLLLSKLSVISFEMFLIHQSLEPYVRYVLDSDTDMIFYIVFVITILVAIVIHRLSSPLLSRITSNGNNEGIDNNTKK